MSNLLGLKKFFIELKKSDQNRINNVILANNISVNEENTLNLIDAVLLEENSSVNNTTTIMSDVSANYHLLFDGQVYNFQDLKNELLTKGVRFKTASEKEVVLYHLIHHGANGIKEIEGDFALAFYNTKENELILARDPFGAKPLLYTLQEEEIIFASRLTDFKTLLPSWSINHQALNAYFQFTYVPAPHTMVKEVKKLMPGHYLHLSKGIAKEEQYYFPKTNKTNNVSYEEAKERVKQKVENAVYKRLNTNKTVGTFLSGGVDSSIVSCITADTLNELNSFSIGFSGNNFFDESPYSEKVANHLRAKHHLTKLSKEQVYAAMQGVVSIFDEPFADSSAVALYFLMEQAKTKVDICLSGDGADEYFAGYHKHNAYLRSKNPGLLLSTASLFANILPGGTRKSPLSNKVRQLKKFKQLKSLKWPDNYWGLATFISQKTREKILVKTIEFEHSLAKETDNLQSFLQKDLTFVLPNDMLRKVDIMARHHQLEVRAPFLDKDLIEFVNQLPSEYKLHKGVGKRVLKDAFRERLPKEVFDRSKRGFEIPLHEWVTATWKEIAQPQWFDDNYLAQQGIFQSKGVQELKTRFNKGEEEACVTIWAYIVFQNWYERWERK